MKKLSFILILLVSVQVLWAQQNKQYTERLDSIITDFCYRDPSKFVFHYDSEGRLTELIAYHKRSEGKWTDPEQRLYTYDEEGRISIITTKSLEEGRNVTPFRERAEYDAKGRLVSWTFEMYSKEKDEWYTPVLQSMRKYEYDAQGNQTAITVYDSGLTGPKETLRTEKEYDKKGQMTIQHDYQFINGEKTLLHIYHYAYDKQGNLIETKRYMSELFGKNPRPDVTRRTTYNKEGKATFTSDTRHNQNMNEEYEEEYTYDTRGNLIQIAYFSRFDHEEKEHSRSMSFTYDLNTKASAVMGLSCPEVLRADEALKNLPNLTYKPLTMDVFHVDIPGVPRAHEHSFYYYSPIEESISPTHLSPMDSVKHNDYQSYTIKPEKIGLE